MKQVLFPLLILISFLEINPSLLNKLTFKQEVNFSKNSTITNSNTSISTSSPVVFMKPVATGAGDGSDWDNALGESDLKVTAEAGGTIYLAAGTYSTSSQIEIRENLCIIGGFESGITGNDTCSYDPITNHTILDGENARRIMRHNNASADSIELRGLILENGNGVGGGGVFFSAVTTSNPIVFKFIDLEVRSNNSNSHGAIFVNNKNHVDNEIQFKNCHFNFNTGERGAAISMNRVRNSDNVAFANSGKLVIEDCFFTNNLATGSGGGAVNIQVSHQWTLRRNKFCNNDTSQGDGGAVRYFDAHKAIITDCEFDENFSDRDGGAISAFQTELYLESSDFVGNNVSNQDNGGAIYGVSSSGIEVVDCKFYSNFAGAGGAIYWDDNFTNTTLNIASNNFFVDNYITNSSTLNSAGGGAMKIFESDWLVENNSFVNNSVPAAAFGGAINLDLSDVELTNNLFFNNQKGTNSNILGADIIVFEDDGNFSPASNNKMQLASAALYLPQQGPSMPDDYDFTNDTFNNTDDGSLPGAPVIVCPSALVTNCLLDGCEPPCEADNICYPIQIVKN